MRHQENWVKGNERHRLLLIWIAADLAVGRNDLIETLRLWRDDVLTRLPSVAPVVCRLPECISSRLGLASRRVRIDHDGSVTLFPKNSLQPTRRLL
jgi:hypothetical protein